VRVPGGDVEQLLELVLGANELGCGKRLEDDGCVSGRLQPELGLERDPRRRDREEPLLIGLLELLAPEEDVCEAQLELLDPFATRSNVSTGHFRRTRGHVRAS
jgi:hypothetical protein